MIAQVHSAKCANFFRTNLYEKLNRKKIHLRVFEIQSSLELEKYAFWSLVDLVYWMEVISFFFQA